MNYLLVHAKGNRSYCYAELSVSSLGRCDIINTQVPTQRSGHTSH